jgi:formylmethanofuran dehydrogenase subunit E
MGLLAGEVLDLELPRRDKRLLVLVETAGCFADGISVVTGCWLGRRTLRLVDYGRVAATIVDTTTGRAVRIRPHRAARDLALDWAPQAQDRWHAQLQGYQRMPASELLQFEPVTLTTPLDQLLGTPGKRLTCIVCGEEILNGRELRGPMCRPCAQRTRVRTATV